MPADPCLMLETKSFGQNNWAIAIGRSADCPANVKSSGHKNLDSSNLSHCWLPSGCKILWSKNWTIAICRSADCPMDAKSFGQKTEQKHDVALLLAQCVRVQSHIPHCGGRGGHSFWLERFEKEAETQELTVKTALGLYDSTLFSQNWVRSLASLCVNGNASGSLPYAGDEIVWSKQLSNSNRSLCWLPSECEIFWSQKLGQ